jgi:colicin import membrane protein
LATTNFPIPEFYTKQYKADNKWQSACLIAAGLHVFALVWAMFLPSFFDHKPLFEEAVIIDLVSVAPSQLDSTGSTPPPQPKIEPKNEIAEPEPTPQKDKVVEQIEPEVVIPEPVEQQVQENPTPAKPISVNPSKRKKKLADDTRLAEVRERERRAARIKRDAEIKRRQEQLKQERRRQVAAEMAEKARLDAQKAAEEARRQLADMYKQQRQLSAAKAATSSQRSNSGGSSQNHSIVAQQYYASLYQHIHAFWVLPELRNWDKDLMATIVLVISRDGKVVSSRIEQRSNDTFFDQLVYKTVQNASPMPSFPAMMNENRIEVGLRFRPGKLEM